ncbi:MAG: hypothetical protein ABFS56_10335 [Pseudomonadota bacterium]
MALKRRVRPTHILDVAVGLKRCKLNVISARYGIDPELANHLSDKNYRLSLSNIL